MNDVRASMRIDRRDRAEGLVSESSVVINAEFRKIRPAAIKIKPAVPSCNPGQGDASSQKALMNLYRETPRAAIPNHTRAWPQIRCTVFCLVKLSDRLFSGDGSASKPCFRGRITKRPFLKRRLWRDLLDLCWGNQDSYLVTRIPRNNELVEPGRLILGVRTLTSQSGFPDRFKIDSHHLGQNQVSAPGDNVESQGPVKERSSGLG